MTHDPLCYRSHDQTLGDDPFCQCGVLHACEKRLLDAAREAVEAMDLHGCHPYRGLLNCNCVGPKVIAAIDALREEPND